MKKSTHPWLPAFIAEYTLSYNEFLMPFADKRSNGMSDRNKYKSQIVSLQKDTEVGLCKKYSHLESAIAKIQQSSSALTMMLHSPIPSVTLGTGVHFQTLHSSKQSTQSLPHYSKGPHSKDDASQGHVDHPESGQSPSIQLPSGLPTLPSSLCKQNRTV